MFYQLVVRLVNFLKRRKVDDILGDSSVALVGKSCIGTSREHIRSSHRKAGAKTMILGPTWPDLSQITHIAEEVVPLLL